MSRPIRKVAVLGSGVMGSGIAAHCANAGIPVLLLDIVPPNASDADKAKKSVRNSFADGALAKLLKSKPASFTHPRNALLVQTGNLEDDLDKVKDADLVIEAVIERLDIKQALFSKLEKICDEHTIIASNTSGLRIVDMVEGRTEQFKANFLITHFFNPPRYMKLLELVAGPQISPEIKKRIENWGQNVLGKGIVWANDTPNFVANRIGAHSMMAVIHLMEEFKLAPEDIDAITGVPMGHPKSATFRTADMVGLDTLGHVVSNCYSVLTNDEDREVFAMPAWVKGMIEKKLLGDKTKAGFYRKGKGTVDTLDPQTGEYRAKGGNADVAKAAKGIAKIESVTERVKKLIEVHGVVGEFAWKSFAKSLTYSANRLGEITDSVKAIDDGMKWGYNWDLGPFEIWDALGFQTTYDRLVKEGYNLPASLKKMRDSGAESFYKGDEIFDVKAGKYVSNKPDSREATLTIMRRGDSPVLKNPGAEAWDLGDGVLGLTFKTKANSIDADVIGMLTQAVERAERDFRGLLLFNQGEFFCVGANLFAVVMAAQAKQWDALDSMVKNLHAGVQRMKYASVPVIAAPYNMTLGGGMELCLASDGVQAASETYAGLVEVGVGLIPGGGGNMNMLWRAFESIPEGVEIDNYAVVTQVFKNIALAKVATSAEEAKAFGFFRSTDGVSFDRARQLHEAKQRVIGIAESGYHAPSPRAYKLPGESGISTLKMLVNSLVSGGYASEHDAKICMKLANVLCGGSTGHTHAVTEQEMLDLEREAFVSLCGEAKSIERMQFMLMNNKPLRN